MYCKDPDQKNNENLHDYDVVLDKIMDLPFDKVALCGIHLCKQLSPSFIGLVNGLGSKCIYASLMPCCMPSAVTSQKRNKNNPKKKNYFPIRTAKTTK